MDFPIANICPVWF